MDGPIPSRFLGLSEQTLHTFPVLGWDLSNYSGFLLNYKNMSTGDSQLAAGVNAR